MKAQSKVTYQRQAFYLFLMKRGYERRDVVDMIKEASAKAKAPYNSGIVCKETKAAEACQNKIQLSRIYSNGINGGASAESIIESIAQSMQNSRLNYDTLYPKQEKKEGNKSKAEKISDFVNTLNKSDLLILEKAIKARRALFDKIAAEKEKAKAQAGKQAKAQEKAEKARKAKQEKTRKAQAKAKAVLALPKAQEKAKAAFEKVKAAQSEAEKARRAGDKVKAEKAKRKAEKASAKADKAEKEARRLAKVVA